jgi:hypothetical protein
LILDGDGGKLSSTKARRKLRVDGCRVCIGASPSFDPHISFSSSVNDVSMVRTLSAETICRKQILPANVNGRSAYDFVE